MNKKEIRETIKQQRSTISVKEILSLTNDIYSYLTTLSKVQSFHTVHTFIGSIQFREVNTLQWIAKWLRENKNIYCPHITPNKLMEPVRLNHLDDLVEGPMGILQPPLGNKQSDTTYDLIIVPGLAFDKSGNRLGYGKGYYDQFLAKEVNVLKVGVCFDFQLFDQLPIDVHDQKVDIIVTNKKVINCLGKSPN